MDLKAIAAKLESLQNPQKGKGSKGNEERLQNFWKPQIGKHLVRFVPLKSNPENPFVELYFHYQFGKRTIISPINFGEKDPIVEFAKNLRKSKDPEDWKLAKKLEPKARYFAPVVVRGEEDKGVRFYEFGKQIYQDLLTYAADEEVGDFTDVMEGRDFKLDVTQGANFKESSIRPAMKSSPLSKDAKEVEKWLEDQKELTDFYKRFTFDEIKGFLESWLNPEEDSSSEESSGLLEPGDVVTAPSARKDKKEVVTENEFSALFEEDNK